MQKHYPTYKQSLGLILMIIPLLIPLLIPLMLLNLDDNDFAIMICSNLALVAMIWIGLWRRKNFSFSNQSFPFSMLVVCYLFLIFFHLVIDPLTSQLPEPEGLAKLLNELLPYPFLLFLLLVVLAPVLEELLFRGIILDGYLKNYSPIMSALVSGLLFGLFHGNLAQGIGAFVMGAVMGLLYWRNQSIAFCILLHALNNFTAFAAILLMDPKYLDQSYQQSINNNTLYFSMVGISTVVCCGCGLYLWNTYLKPVKNLITAKPVQDEPVFILENQVSSPKA